MMSTLQILSTLGIFLLCCFNTITTKANITQEPTKNKLLHVGLLNLTRNYTVQLRPYGFLRHETHWDNRQAFGSQELQSFLFPEPFVPDVLGRDINAHPDFHMSPVQTCLGFELTGPNPSDDITITGIVEGDFRGTTIPTISSYALRHIYAMINWQQGALLIGQFSSPLYVEDALPRQLDYDSGSPFEFFARFPQFRLTQQFAITETSALEVIAAALTQRDFQSPGPIGFTSEYIRNAVVPNLHLQVRSLYEDTVFGLAFDYKRLVPRLVSNKNYKVHEHVDSFITAAYIAFNTQPFSVRLKGSYSQNATEFSVISGYAVATIDPVTDFRTYTPTASANFWIDANYAFPDKVTQIGIFAGYSKNLGSSKKLFIDPATNLPIIYDLQTTLFEDNITRKQEIQYVFRIAPRITYFWEPLLFGLEINATSALWGKPNEFAQVPNGHLVTNCKVLFIVDYFF